MAWDRALEDRYLWVQSSEGAEKEQDGDGGGGGEKITPHRRETGSASLVILTWGVLSRGISSWEDVGGDAGGHLGFANVRDVKNEGMSSGG